SRIGSSTPHPLTIHSTAQRADWLRRRLSYRAPGGLAFPRDRCCRAALDGERSPSNSSAPRLSSSTLYSAPRSLRQNLGVSSLLCSACSQDVPTGEFGRRIDISQASGNSQGTLARTTWGRRYAPGAPN